MPNFLRLNLQFFSEEDMILPDDFQETPPQVEETPLETELPLDTVEDTTETEQSEEMSEQQLEEQRQAFLKVKYNKEEMELDEATARELAQKGLNYDKLQERLQSLETDPRLSFVEELAREQGMNVSEFLDAVKQSREQQRIDELVQKGISEEVAQELLETRKFREQMEAEKQAKVDEAKKNAEFQEFFSYFTQANGRDFNPSTDQIPAEVWEAHAQGTPLRYAYMEHHTNQLKQQLQVLKQNETNTKKAPIGSITSHGSTEVASDDDFLSGFNSI